MDINDKEFKTAIHNEIDSWLNTGDDIVRYCSYCKEERNFKKAWEIKETKNGYKLIKHTHCEACGNKGPLEVTSKRTIINKGIPKTKKVWENILERRDKYYSRKKDIFLDKIRKDKDGNYAAGGEK